jgi:hypothetical protein
MSRTVSSVSITKLEDSRYRAAVDYHEQDGQATGGEVTTFDTFEEATNFVIDREANPSAAPAPKEQTELGSPEPGHTGLAQSAPHSADPSAQDSPVSQGAQDSPVDQTAAAPSNPADLQNENTAHSDALAADNETAKAEQDAGTAN